MARKSERQTKFQRLDNRWDNTEVEKEIIFTLAAKLVDWRGIPDTSEPKGAWMGVPQMIALTICCCYFNNISSINLTCA